MPLCANLYIGNKIFFSFFPVQNFSLFMAKTINLLLFTKHSESYKSNVEIGFQPSNVQAAFFVETLEYFCTAGRQPFCLSVTV